MIRTQCEHVLQLYI